MKKENLEEVINYFNYLEEGDNITITFDFLENIEKIKSYIENSIPKEVIIDRIRERQFELQQEYKDFKNDIELNTLQELLEGK